MPSQPGEMQVLSEIRRTPAPYADESSADQIIAEAKQSAQHADELLRRLNAFDPNIDAEIQRDIEAQRTPIPLRDSIRTLTEGMQMGAAIPGVAAMVPSPASPILGGVATLMALPNSLRKLVSPDEDESRLGGAIETGLSAIPAIAGVRRMTSPAAIAGRELAKVPATRSAWLRDAVREAMDEAGESPYKFNNLPSPSPKPTPAAFGRVGLETTGDAAYAGDRLTPSMSALIQDTLPASGLEHIDELERYPMPASSAVRPAVATVPEAVPMAGSVPPEFHAVSGQTVAPNALARRGQAVRKAFAGETTPRPARSLETLLEPSQPSYVGQMQDTLALVEDLLKQGFSLDDARAAALAVGR